MFMGGFEESVRGIVHIHVPDVDPYTFKALLAYLYLDKISLNETIVFELLYCSKKYMLPFLTKECIKYICSIVKANNAILLMSKTKVYDCPEFWDKCWDVISKFPDFREILKRSKAVFFDAALRWATHQLSVKDEKNEEEDPRILGWRKREMLGTALNYICFQKMSFREIAELVVPSCVLSSIELVNLFVSKALMDH
ncbi:BTBD3_6 [Lepeophtheirus salmonis]|uniref:BTBD3_6 n=1 Tax=Lepeophtheirus salmonis TaxID=72036 RepID=A0A7R8CUP2_LEPSM|nr:BTBD3_6 [Lepeophtheirus salmonis]CAF2938302.1 BTBD3_6 [Lepeophtheirus salmonis]